jgi:DNA polymerase
MKTTQKDSELKKIAEEIRNLGNFALANERRINKVLPVFGDGSSNAQIMFIGEAPGKNESEKGKPFCGRSGKVLDSLLESAGISRSDVYITNIVKDRPPGNRDPLPEEIALYVPFLEKEIEIIKPKVIATLGRISMAYILDRYNVSEEKKQISTLHGKIFKANASYGEIVIMPLYHPAVAVYNAKMYPVLQADVLALKNSV